MNSLVIIHAVVFVVVVISVTIILYLHLSFVYLPTYTCLTIYLLTYISI